MIRYFEEIEIDSNFSNETMESEFVECHFTVKDLSSSSFKSSKIIECHFSGVNLSNIEVTNISIRDTKFHGCKIIGVNWSSIQTLSHVHFEECLMDMSTFQNLNLSGAKFINCSLVDVDFSESNLIKSSFYGSRLDGATFSNCNLSSADLRECRGYQIDPAITKIKKAKFSMPEALALLSAFDISIE
ncbi:hypothetical protein BIY24_07300 [Halobacteriovorax marinus]|uniref:pentapeptide repeat-containing protein n=1 Tax=Halobacteriovorax marinus TaxID=97084 RepID=UPI000BC31728|nr:pentapeptide repeat-containing protein [Halobacteriovorax marinus]ATH07758.1 hypothetical protein BIY24_07300 [Halobacteriovorax marinus]